MVATVSMLIEGQWREGAKTYEVRDPYRNEVIACAPESTLQDLEDALAAASAAKAQAATVQPFTDLNPLFERASAEQYGLHAGIFTKSLKVSFDAIRRLRVGGAIINGTSTWRTDQLAYGGIKASGIGR